MNTDIPKVNLIFLEMVYSLHHDWAHWSYIWAQKILRLSAKENRRLSAFYLSMMVVFTFQFLSFLSTVYDLYCLLLVCVWKKMEFFISQTNREKKSLFYDGYTFRVDRVLKNSDISWRCTKKQLQVQNKNRRRVQIFYDVFF
jgi:hypothetical protein